jgi:hypothetical protein
MMRRIEDWPTNRRTIGIHIDRTFGLEGVREALR